MAVRSVQFIVTSQLWLYCKLWQKQRNLWRVTAALL